MMSSVYDATHYNDVINPRVTQATEERRNMYTQIMQRTVSSRVQGSEGHGGSSSYKQAQLSTKDTFKLYKTFMGLAEADEGMQVIMRIGAIILLLIELYIC